MPGPHATVRPGDVADDPTGRFTYWPHRIARGAKSSSRTGRANCQFIDVRDLASWPERPLRTKGQKGVSTAINEGVSWLELAETVATSQAAKATHYVDGDYLADQAWTSGWSPAVLHDPEAVGMHMTGCVPTIDAGSHSDLSLTRPRTLDEANYGNGGNEAEREASSRLMEGSVDPSNGGFDFVHRETVRFRDVRFDGHVNKRLLLTYIEDARIAYLLHSARGVEHDLARAEIDFRAPLRWVTRSRSECALPALQKSFELEYEVRSGKACRRSKTVIVSFDYVSGQSVESPNLAGGTRRLMGVFEDRTLPNGLRLLTAPMEHAQSVSCFVCSRGLPLRTPETAASPTSPSHMFFKGTEGGRLHATSAARSTGSAESMRSGQGSTRATTSACAGEHRSIAPRRARRHAPSLQVDPEEDRSRKGVIVER